MATQADVRRIALSFPATEQASDRFAFSVRRKGKLKGFAWVWMKRVDPKKARVPEPTVIALRVSDLAARDRMLSAEPDKFFTEPHYAGFPAVLLRLAVVTPAELRPLVEQAWRSQAPPDFWKEPKMRPSLSTTAPKPRKNTLPRSVVAAIDASQILGVRAGEGSPHRFIGIWPVVIDGRVFGRSWSLKPGGWYRTFLEDARGAIQIGPRVVRIRAVPVRSERVRDAVESAYAAKYPGPGSRKYVRGFRTKRRRLATMEFVPR
ncbi:MAG TPA: DUF2255 family protein [Vicinamibacterales bacterium]|jgi:hypothetical protein